jgi:transmembrane sensor
LRVAGSFQSSNAEDFVRLLEQGYPLRVEAQDEKLLLLAR